MVFNAVFNGFSIISRQPVHLSMHFWSSLYQYSAQFSKPLAAFPLNHCRKNGQHSNKDENVIFECMKMEYEENQHSEIQRKSVSYKLKKINFCYIRKINILVELLKTA